jgi:hypothetical protein
MNLPSALITCALGGVFCPFRPIAAMRLPWITI